MSSQHNHVEPTLEFASQSSGQPSPGWETLAAMSVGNPTIAASVWWPLEGVAMTLPGSQPFQGGGRGHGDGQSPKNWEQLGWGWSWASMTQAVEVFSLMAPNPR